MKLLVELIRCNDCVRSITEALLKLDLGARICISDSHKVSVEGRLTLSDAAQAIEAHGFRAARVLDPVLTFPPWEAEPCGSWTQLRATKCVSI